MNIQLADVLTNAGVLGVLGIIYQTVATTGIKASLDNRYNAKLESLKAHHQTVIT